MDLRLLELIESRVSKEEFATIADSSPEMLAEFNKYRAIVELEKLIASDDAQLDEDFSAAIMNQVFAAESKSLEPLEQELDSFKPDNERAACVSQFPRVLIESLVAVNSILSLVFICLLVASSKRPIQYQTISSIPQGYQPVSFEVSLPKEQLRSRNLRLDLRVQFGKQVQEIATYLPVVAIKEFENDAFEKKLNDNSATLTVLAPATLAKQISLARVLGNLDISLVSLTEQPRSLPKIQNGLNENFFYDLQGRVISVDMPAVSQAVLYLATEPDRTASRHVFRHGEWVHDEKIWLEAF